jgi:hypothetical protein
VRICERTEAGRVDRAGLEAVAAQMASDIGVELGREPPRQGLRRKTAGRQLELDHPQRGAM